MHRREFLGAVGAALAAGVPLRASAQAQSWPDKPVKLDPSVWSRRRQRSHRTPLGGEAQPSLRPAVRDREPRRRRGHDRHRGGLEGGARRLHLPAHTQRDADGAADHAQDALRPGQELRPRRARGRSRVRVRDPSRRGGENLPGADRVRQGQSREAGVRLGGPRLRLAPAHRDSSSTGPASTSCSCPIAAARTPSTICSPTPCR